MSHFHETAALLADLEGRALTNFTRKLRVYSSSFLAAVLDKPEKAKTLEKQDKCILFSGLLRGADVVVNADSSALLLTCLSPWRLQNSTQVSQRASL